MTHHARCRVFRRRCASRTWWVWTCLDGRCAHADVASHLAGTTWTVAVGAALAHTTDHDRRRRLAV